MQTARTIASSKPDIIICDNGKEKGTRTLLDVAIYGDRNVIKQEAEKILKYKDITRAIQSTWKVKTKMIPVTIGGDWNHLKITQTIPDQQTWKARNQEGIIENGPHWAPHTPTAGSAKVKCKTSVMA